MYYEKLHAEHVPLACESNVCQVGVAGLKLVSRASLTILTFKLNPAAVVKLEGVT